MAKARGFLSRIFTRAGGSLFRLLSKFEDTGVLPKAARWAKLSLLGLFVTIVSALSLKANDDIIRCYVPVPPPHLTISDVSVRPNPTGGRDTVTVKAEARIVPLYYDEDSIISQAFIEIQGDTLRYPMTALDGKFDDTLEAVEGKIYVGDLEPETTWIFIYARTSSGNAETGSWQLIISAPEADSTDKKED